MPVYHDFRSGIKQLFGPTPEPQKHSKAPHFPSRGSGEVAHDNPDDSSYSNDIRTDNS